jgi:hypothetical protein
VHQLDSVLLDGRGHKVGPIARGNSCQSNQHNAYRETTLAKHQLAKVLIRGQQESSLAVRLLQYRDIGKPRLHFGNVLHMMAIFTERTGNLSIDTFIGQKVHLTVSPIG